MGIFNFKPALKIVDNEGSPIKGAVRTIFPEGDVGFAVAYKDPDLLETQPIASKSDENGEFPLCYLQDGVYRVKISSPRDKEPLLEVGNIRIKSGNTQLHHVFEMFDDLANDQLLSTVDQTGRFQLDPDCLISVKSTGMQYRALGDSEIGQFATAGGVQLSEAGVRYSTQGRFVDALARGETFSIGETILAGGAVFVFKDDGNTSLPGLAGWSLVASEANFAATDALKTKSDLLSVTQPINLDSLPALVASSNTYDSVGNGLAGTSNGESFIVVTSPGHQLYRNDLGVESFVGWIGEIQFDTTSNLLESNHAFPDGSIVKTRSARNAYKVRPPSATDNHLETAGGIKLDVLPTDGAFHVDAFGAIGDSVTDDTAAIQAALSASSTEVAPVGKVTFSSKSTYLVTDELIVTNTLHIDGCGARVETTLDAGAKALFMIGQDSNKTYRYLIENLTIASMVGTSGSDGIKLVNAGLTTFRRVYVTGFTKQLVLAGGAVDPFIGWLTIDDCYFQGGDYGIYGAGVPVNVTSIRACRFLQHAKHGVRFDDSTALTIEGNDFSLCEVGAGFFASAGAVRVTGNYTESCGSGTEGNLAELFTFNDSHDIIVSGANHFGGAHGGWRDRTHVRFGIACYACREVLIESNSFSYFQETPVFFDAQTGPNCRVFKNTYSTNFPDPVGFPVQDLSGRVDIEGIKAQPLDGRDFSLFENFVCAPREIANNWAIGDQILAQRNFVNSSPPGDTRNLADKITVLGGGTDKSISHATANVTGGVGKTFATRFWVKLENVVVTPPLSGLASLEMRIFDGTALLNSQHINLTKQWSFHEIEFVDPNATTHALTIDIRPSDSVYMEFAYSIAGIQLCNCEAPYIYPKYSANTHYARKAEGHCVGSYPKMSVKDDIVVSENIGTNAPGSGDWLRGDKVWNTAPSIGGHIGWVCVTAGTPGIWKPFGVISV